MVTRKTTKAVGGILRIGFCEPKSLGGRFCTSFIQSICDFPATFPFSVRRIEITLQPNDCALEEHMDFAPAVGWTRGLVSRHHTINKMLRNRHSFEINSDSGCYVRSMCCSAPWRMPKIPVLSRIPVVLAPASAVARRKTKRRRPPENSGKSMFLQHIA